MTIRQISDVALGAFGPGVYKRVIQAMGLDLEYYNYKDCSSGIEAVASEKGRQPNTPTVRCTVGVFACLQQLVKLCFDIVEFFDLGLLNCLALHDDHIRRAQGGQIVERGGVGDEEVC